MNSEYSWCYRASSCQALTDTAVLLDQVSVVYEFYTDSLESKSAIILIKYLYKTSLSNLGSKQMVVYDDEMKVTLLYQQCITHQS